MTGVDHREFLAQGAQTEMKKVTVKIPILAQACGGMKTAGSATDGVCVCGGGLSSSVYHWETDGIHNE